MSGWSFNLDFPLFLQILKASKRLPLPPQEDQPNHTLAVIDLVKQLLSRSRSLGRNTKDVLNEFQSTGILVYFFSFQKHMFLKNVVLHSCMSLLIALVDPLDFFFLFMTQLLVLPEFMCVFQIVVNNYIGDVAAIVLAGFAYIISNQH